MAPLQGIIPTRIPFLHLERPMENSSLMWKRLPAFVARVKGRNDFRRIRFLKVLVVMGAFCEEGNNWFGWKYIPWRKVPFEVYTSLTFFGGNFDRISWAMHQPAKNGDEITDYGNIIVTARELASALGLSEQNIYNLKRRGIFQSLKAKRSEFQLGPSVRAYVQFKCGQDSQAEADYHRERALKEKANRGLREILVKQTRDQLHRCEDVESIQTHSNNQIRSRLLEFSNSLALQLIGKEPAETKAIIDTEVRKVLVGLSRYDPRDYYRWLARPERKSIAGLS
jgi:hypothetical protein